jgi:glycerol uptake facilitator-like aquaporin
MASPLSRRLVAEGLGTALLLTAVVGSGIMGDSLASGNVAIALLANTIATAAALVALILTFGPISGAHLNPAVTLVERLERRLSTQDSAGYIVVQVVGACAGVVLAHLMFDKPALMVSTHVRSGLSQGLSEAVAAFGLVCVILSGIRFRASILPFSVAAYITAAYWFTASTSFANPAVTIARSLTDTFAGIRPVDVPLFIVAQVIGALTAAALFRWLSPLDRGETR